MIFVTVGTQLPFDRLVRRLDELAPSLDEPVFAQVGASGYRPRNMEWVASLPGAEFVHRFAAASTIIAHAGVGTVLMAQRWGKPIILLPREARLGEHRNDHQLATCARLEGQTGIYVAANEGELAPLLAQNLLPARAEPVFDQRDKFVAALRRHLHQWS